MIEARAFVDTLDTVRNRLEEMGFELAGEYEITDEIYRTKNPETTLIDKFMRFRRVPVNIWPEKEYIVAVKITHLKKVGKDSEIPIKMQFDTREDAEEYIKDNMLDDYEYDFEFSRIGWQYNLDDKQVDLEDINNGHFSIEAKAQTDHDLEELLKQLGITETIKGPSVVAVKKLLDK